MQKIKTVRFQPRNIGGDRCFAKLRYVIGTDFKPSTAIPYHVVKLPFNVGCQATGATGVNSIFSVFGSTPNLSTLAQLYQNYRIRGIKLVLTAYYVPALGEPPICLFATAQSSSGTTRETNPTPTFPTPAINVTPEQRWTKSRVIGNAAAGAKPTTLSVYYSVNKVYGPDAVVKNDKDFIGDLITGSPFWSNTVNQTDDASRPVRGPWLMYGIYSMDQFRALSTTMDLTLKVEATVYTEMFSKRPAID